MAIDYLILMSEKYLQFRKGKSIWRGRIFQPCRSNLVLWECFSKYVFLRDMYKNLKEIGIIQAVSKLTIFVNL